MKKFLSTFVLLSLLIVLLSPVLVSAQAPQNCTLKRDFTSIDSACQPKATVSIEDHGMCCLLNTIYNITDWIFLFLLGLASIWVILGAMNILTAGGDPSKVASGRNYIIYAMIGLLIAFLAKAIPNIVKMIMGAT